MNARLTSILLTTIFLVLMSCADTKKEPWQELFNGKDLTGWVQRNGEAIYTVEDDMIVGTTVANTPNSFLCTVDTFSNFILEVDVMVDTSLNSGIQIRSNACPGYRDGRVHGYQVEIDPSDRAYSGGIYDEARRGWLYDLSENEAGRKAFKNGEWNHYRIEAIDSSIRTFINGVMCANLVDDWDKEGFIALQVHQVNVEENPWTEGISVKWKNIKVITEEPEKYVKEVEDPVPVKGTLLNRLSEPEKEEGWMLLWDGQTTNGWHRAYQDEFPEKGWVIEDGALKVLASGGAESRYGGDIVTDMEFRDFELKVQFKLTPGANSGIKYFVTEQEENNPGSAIGLEYQILDDQRHPDAKKGKNGNRTLASLYDLIPAENKPTRPIGEWNQARIIHKDKHVEHWLNGRKVLEYERGSDAFRALVAESKYKIWPNFGEAESGHILLQDHGNEVWFRDIKIRVPGSKF